MTGAGAAILITGAIYMYTGIGMSDTYLPPEYAKDIAEEHNEKIEDMSFKPSIGIGNDNINLTLIMGF